MEDLFDNLIYILIVLVGFIISALGKKKKKDAQQRVQPIQQEPDAQPKERPFLSNLERLINEELGLVEEKHENTYVEELQEEESESILDSPVSKLDTTEDKIDSIPEEIIDEEEEVPYSIEYDDTSDIIKHSIKDADMNEEEESDLLKEFDLEDGIIYSEIINRKEY